MAKRAINSNMYEYAFVWLDVNNIVAILNARAKEGWEPFLVIPGMYTTNLLLRRLVVDDPGSEGSPLEGVARG